MNHKTRLYSAAAALLAPALRAQSTEQQIIADAASAMGGRDRILAVKTLVVQGGGHDLNVRPVAPLRRAQRCNRTRGRFATTSGPMTWRTRVRASRWSAPRNAPISGHRRRARHPGLDGDVALQHRAQRQRHAACSVARPRPGASATASSG